MSQRDFSYDASGSYIEPELQELHELARERKELEEREQQERLLTEYEKLPVWESKEVAPNVTKFTWRSPAVQLLPGARTQQGGRYLDRLTSEERKQYPMGTGLVDYFPDALALVSHISWLGNEKHNPGQPLHHSRGKSNDHFDCAMRHASTNAEPEGAVEFGHLAESIWRELALLQERMEKRYNLSLPPGAREDET